MRDISIRQADFANPADVDAYTHMLDAYACDPIGNNRPLDARVRKELGPRLAEHPGALAWLAWLEEQPVGVLTAFLSFSTFAAQPRINIHDVAVLPGQRGLGIGRKLIEAVEHHARSTGCCALTLEVRYDNPAARHLYTKLGFTGPTDWHPPETMAFWKKTLE